MSSQFYRLYYDDILYDPDLEALEASSPEAALVLFGFSPNDEDYEKHSCYPLPQTLQSECVCVDDKSVVDFVNLQHPQSPGEWQCQNCNTIYIKPPDEINWEWERMFAKGYVPCPTCDSYRDNCPYCGGAGWWKPGERYDADESEGQDQ